MKKKYILREAAVLLFTALMVTTSVNVLANTNVSIAPAKPVNPTRSVLIWDNTLGYYGSLGGIIVSDFRTDGTGDATAADDFQLETAQEVNSVVWQGGYFQCQLGTGQHDYNWDWKVLFWTDDGTGNQPGTKIYNQTIYDANITRSFWYNYTNPNGNTYWVANYSAALPASIEFAANTKYWITIEGVGGGTSIYPQSCWTRHNESFGGIKLHEAMLRGAAWGHTNWDPLSIIVTDLLPHDLNYQLYGGAVADTTPPVTTISLNGTMSGGVYITPVTVTLTATDDSSGVNFTMYKIDSGALTLYSGPFVVSAQGTHTILYYSVDKAGNKEADKTSTFTIQYPVEITIKGGVGITATIKNNGTVNMTNVDWTIGVTGGLVIIGKNKNGTIDSIAVGKTAKVRDFVLGFGTITITVSAGDTQATATGKVLLFLVIGVK